MTRNGGFVTTAWPAIAVTVVVVGILVALLVATAPPPPGRTDAPRLVMYCAAGMSGPVTKIAADYQREFGVEVQTDFAGSGALLSKMRAARPEQRGQVYLAADESYVAAAREHGLIAETIPIAHIRPVIAVAPDNPLNIRSVDDLLRDDVRVVLANPELASIGRTFEQAMRKAGKWDAIERRVRAGGVSFAGTVNEVAAAVKSGSADAGVVWDSSASIFKIAAVDDPAFVEFTQTITVAAVVPNDQPAAALRFMRYLTARDKGLKHFAEVGFDVVADADTFTDRGPVLLMAGAMLKPAIDEAVTAFEQREGVVVDRVYNGCGILVSQMKAGTKPDAYFSCDVSFMTQVADRFDASTIVTRNPMVILVPKGNPRKIASLSDLAPGGGGMKIGLAHPTHSALGALTDHLLVDLNLRDRIYAANTVIHADAGHLLVNQMLVGSLDAAVVYRSNALATPGNTEHYDVIALAEPQAFATQPFAAAPGHRYLMRRLFDAVTDAESRRRFDSLGFIWLRDPPAAP